MPGQAQIAWAYMAKVQGDDLGRLIDMLEPRYRRAFREVVSRIEDQQSLADLEELLALGRVDEALTAVEAHAALLAGEITAGYVAGGQAAAEFLTTQLNTSIVFDQTNELAVRQIRASNLGRIVEFSQEQRRATRSAITQGITEGLNPRAQARRFRDSIGLTEYQERIVSNYRRQLSEGDLGALQRDLRDRRFDRTVRRNAKQGTALSEAQIDKMTTRYRERWIKYRSEAIARTEALRSAHQGADEMYRQAIDAGELDPAAIIRKWDTRMDGRQRGWHGSMEGQTRTWGEPFRSGQGSELRYPGDPNAPASETIHCRCVIVTRLDPAKL